MLAGLGLAGFQVFIYLKSGEWVEVPLKALVEFGPTEFTSWLHAPTSWVGLHKIISGALEFMPLSLSAVNAGAAMMGYQAEPKSPSRMR